MRGSIKKGFDPGNTDDYKTAAKKTSYARFYDS